jgi:PAS domain S-box-containing protein
LELFPRELAARYYADEQAIIQSGEGLYDYDGPTVDANKEEKDRWVSMTKPPLRDTQGKIMGFVDIGRDITKLKQAEDALKESEERYALATRGAHDGLWDWNLKTNTLYYSSRWKFMFGCSENEIGISLHKWFSRVHPEDIEWLRTEISHHLEGRTTDFQSEYCMRHRDGTYLWVLSRGRGNSRPVG